MVLSKHSNEFRLGSFSEASHSTEVTIELAAGEKISTQRLSRVDRMWAFFDGQTWIKFAIVEFKRPGALIDGEWEPAIQGRRVTGSANVMCRQVIKYCYCYNVRFAIICDGHKMVCLKVGGTKTNWVNETPFVTTSVPTEACWVGTRDEMKRYGYVFLQEALKAKLIDSGFAV